MPKLFVVEDRSHCDWMGRFASFAEAWAELERLAGIAWDAEPNRAPCTNWRTCGREYGILEVETSTQPWTLEQRHEGPQVNAQGVVWPRDREQRDLDRPTS